MEKTPETADDPTVGEVMENIRRLRQEVEEIQRRVIDHLRTCPAQSIS